MAGDLYLYIFRSQELIIRSELIFPKTCINQVLKEVRIKWFLLVLRPLLVSHNA